MSVSRTSQSARTSAATWPLPHISPYADPSRRPLLQSAGRSLHACGGMSSQGTCAQHYSMGSESLKVHTAWGCAERPRSPLASGSPLRLAPCAARAGRQQTCLAVHAARRMHRKELRRVWVEWRHCACKPDNMHRGSWFVWSSRLCTASSAWTRHVFVTVVVPHCGTATVRSVRSVRSADVLLARVCTGALRARRGRARAGAPARTACRCRRCAAAPRRPCRSRSRPARCRTRTARGTWRSRSRTARAAPGCPASAAPARTAARAGGRPRVTGR